MLRGADGIDIGSLPKGVYIIIISSGWRASLYRCSDLLKGCTLDKIKVEYDFFCVDVNQLLLKQMTFLQPHKFYATGCRSET